MKQFYYESYRASFTSVMAVMGHMLTLQDELRGTTMHNLRAFNYTYYIITKNVFSLIGTQYFRNEVALQELDKNFASYYFDALKNYISGKTCPPAWEYLFSECESHTHYSFIYMAMGVNAHVNNDLGQSLYDTASFNHSKADFDSINTVIRESLPEVVASLHEDSRTIRLLKRSGYRMYCYYLYYLIQNWRKNAWNNYRQLHKNTRYVKNHERKAKQLAHRLSHITTPFHLPRLFLLRY